MLVVVLEEEENEKQNKETDEAIIQDAKAEPFTSPRRIRRKLELDKISPRTVDRRLQEGGLYGRVTRHKRDYSDDEVRKRRSFAKNSEMIWCVHGYTTKEFYAWSFLLILPI